MKNLYLMAGIACIALASCSKEDTPSITAKNELGVAATVVQSGPGTRALVSGTAFGSGSSINVFMANIGVGTGYDGTIGTYTYDGTGWNDLAHSVILTADAGTVYSYYPSSATIAPAGKGTAASTVAVSLPASESSFTGAGQTDYMYGTAAKATDGTYPAPTASSSTNSVNLYMHHALSKISFIINNWGYAGTGNVSKIKLATAGTTPPTDFNAGTATMAIANGVLTWSGTKVSELDFTAATTALINTTASSTTVVATGLAAPTASDISDVVNLTLTIDGKDVTAQLPFNNPAKTGIQWLPGNDYQYTVAVNGNSLVVLSVNVVDWIVNNVNSTNPINVKP